MVALRRIILEDLGLATVAGVPCYRSQITYLGRVELSVTQKDLVDLGGAEFRTIEDYAVMCFMNIPDYTPIVNRNEILIGMFINPLKPKSLFQRILETLGLSK